MVSERLARTIPYLGQVMGPGDMELLIVAEYNRQRLTRRVLGPSAWLRKAPSVTWVVGALTPTVRITNLDGMVNHLPLYTSTPQDVEVWDANVGELGDTAVSGIDKYRAVILGVTYTERGYDLKNDLNNTQIQYRRDDGVCLKVIGGVEQNLEDAPDPTVPDGVIPIARFVRSWDDDAAIAAGTKLIQPIHTYYMMNETFIKDFGMWRQLIGCPAGLVYRPEAVATDRYLPRLKIDVDGSNDTVIIRDDLYFLIDGYVRRLSDTYSSGTDDGETYYWKSDALSLTGTYGYIRAQLDAYGVLRLYVVNGSEPSTGSAYTPSPNAPVDTSGTNGAAPSSMYDVLIGRITKSPGPVYTVEAYDSNPDYTQSGSVTGSYSAGQEDHTALIRTVTLTRPSAHDISIDVRPSNHQLTGVHPADRVPSNQLVHVVHTRHHEVRLNCVGVYSQVDGSTLKVPSTDKYFIPGIQYLIRPRFYTTT